MSIALNRTEAAAVQRFIAFRSISDKLIWNEFPLCILGKMAEYSIAFFRIA